MRTQIIDGRRVVDARDVRKLATPGSVHVDQLMTDFAVSYGNLPFVTDRLFPAVPVVKESDKYAIFNATRKGQKNASTLRAPKSKANVVDWDHTTATYSCDEHALASGVDDRERANADEPIRPDQRATAAATIGIHLAREIRIATLMTTAGNYAADHKATLAGADQWSHADSTPLNEAQDAQEAIEKDAGVTYNTMVISRAVFNRLRLHPDITETFKYTQGLVSMAELERYFDLPQDGLIVPGAFQNTAALGAAAVMARIWGDFAWFGFVDPGANSPLDGITFGKTFRVSQEGQPILVREFREDAARTDWKEVGELVDEKITAALCGYLLSDVMA